MANVKFEIDAEPQEIVGMLGMLRAYFIEPDTGCACQERSTGLTLTEAEKEMLKRTLLKFVDRMTQDRSNRWEHEFSVVPEVLRVLVGQ